MVGRLWVLGAALLSIHGSIAWAAEFREESEERFSLRSLGRFQVINRRGSVSVQGWPLDKIRVRAEKVVEARSEAEAQLAFATMGFRLSDQGRLELGAIYGRELGFRRKLLEEKNQIGRVDLEVWAPYNLDLRIWAAARSVTVRDWKSNVEIRTEKGEVEVNGVSAEQMTVQCANCEVSISDLEAELVSVQAGDREISLYGVNSEQLFVQTRAGGVRAGNVRGQQVYVSKSGSINGRSLRGEVRFQSQSGGVQVVESYGSVSGRTETGSIRLEMRNWTNGVDSFLETIEGAITAFLPSDFSGILALRSKRSTAQTRFPYRLANLADAYGPQPIDRLRAVVRGGSGLFSVSSVEGKVEVVPIQ